MHALGLLGGTLLLVGLMSSEAVAQRIVVPSGPLQAGSQVAVGYSNPAMAGKTVTITIQGVGFPVPPATTVDIKLNAAGDGAAPWTVPDWTFVSFNALSAEEVLRGIDEVQGSDGTG